MKKSTVSAGLVLFLAAATAVILERSYFTDDVRLRRLGREFIATNDSRVGYDLAAAAVKAGTKATPILVVLLHDPKLKTPGYVVDALGALGPVAQPAVPDLLGLLDSERKRSPNFTFQEGKGSLLVADVVSALGKIKDERAIVPIRSLIAEAEGLGDYQQVMAFSTAVGALAGFGSAAKDVTPVLSQKIWGGWRGIICNQTGNFAPEIRETLARDCADIEALQSIKVLLKSPASGSVSGTAVTFAWTLTGGKEGTTYCPAVLTDKGSNPFDGSLEDDFPARKNVLSLAGELDWGRYKRFDIQWGVRVWACRDLKADCSAAKRPPRCVTLFSGINLLHVR